MIEDDIIPVITIVSAELDTGDALDEIIENLQTNAAFNYCFLSAEYSNKPNVNTVVMTLKNLDDLTKKLAKAYIIKAAGIYDQHLNQFHIQKTQQEYEQESDLAGSMIDFVAEFNPALRLEKENKLTYTCYDDQRNIVITAMISSFRRNTTAFVNDGITSMIEFNEIIKKPEIRETLNKYFGSWDS